MSAHDDPRRVSEWIHGYAAHRVPAHLDRVLAETSRRRQRPAWSIPERWLPVQTTLRLAPMPRLGWVVLIALTLAAAVGIALVAVGSRQRPAPPFGLARNGPVIYDKAGDIYRFDPETGTSTLIVGGPESDVSPRFSRDGRSFVFFRGNDVSPTAVMVADADGGHVRTVTGPLTNRTFTDWSPDGSRLAFVSTVDGASAITVADADGTGSQVLNVGMPATEASWAGSDGTDLLFRGGRSGAFGLYLVSADGSGPPRAVPGTVAAPDTYMDPVVSLDGRKGAYVSFEQTAWQPTSGPRTADWDGMLLQVHVVDLVTGEDVVITPGTDPLIPSQPVDETHPVFSPDGKLIAVARDRSDGAGWLAVAPADGSEPGKAVGGDFVPSQTEGPAYEFTPDATGIVVAYPDADDAFLAPVGGGEVVSMPRSGWGIPSMQRQAP